MTPLSMANALRKENGELRGLTGSGEPGLSVVLGGTAKEEGADSLRMTGGAGQVSSVSRIASAHRDMRLAAVAAGQPPSGGGSGTGGSGGGSGVSKPPQGRPPGQAK